MNATAAVVERRHKVELLVLARSALGPVDASDGASWPCEARPCVPA